MGPSAWFKYGAHHPGIFRRRDGTVSPGAGGGRDERGHRDGLSSLTRATSDYAKLPNSQGIIGAARLYQRAGEFRPVDSIGILLRLQAKRPIPHIAFPLRA